MGREVKRVAVDFEWTLNKVWGGFLNPYYQYCHDCGDCDGSGYSVRGKFYHDQWYGNGYTRFIPEKPFTPDHPIIREKAEFNYKDSPQFYRSVDKEAERLCDHFNSAWCYHITDADVAVLREGGRLRDMDQYTTDEVNEWSLSGFGHDSTNCWLCVKARCKEEGVEDTCSTCDGDGNTWEPGAERLCDSWESVEPPGGTGWQLWETVSEGSPVSPVFETAQELARWLSESVSGMYEMSYEKWLSFVTGPGWAPSAVLGPNGFQTGVEALSENS